MHRKIMKKDGQTVEVDVASGSVQVMEEQGWKAIGDAPPDPEPERPAEASSGWQPKPTREALDDALDDLTKEGHTDPEYVVGGMRRFFGDLFTAEDEKFVRDTVKPKAPVEETGADPDYSDMTKAQIRELLDAKGVAHEEKDNKDKLVERLKASNPANK